MDSNRILILSKKFQLIKNEIEAKNLTFARELLDEISFCDLSELSKDLYRTLYQRSYQSEDCTEATFSGACEESTLDTFDAKEVKQGISIVSCCMNRNQNLLKALKTWVKLPVDEIILVDWSSDILVKDTVKSVNDQRIKILRVEGESKWVLSYGFNVGLRFTSYSKVYKLDADIEVAPDFLELNYFKKNEFIRGSWKDALEIGNDDQVFINGSFGAYKSALKEIGYYNELITTYGWDDSDLYERLASVAGLATKHLDVRSLLHLEQDDADRTASQDVILDNYLGIVKPTEFNNQRNKYIGRTTDYWNLGRLQNYKLKRNSRNNWIVNRITSSEVLPKYIVDSANLYAANTFLLFKMSSLYEGKVGIESAKFMFKEYENKVPFSETETLLGANQIKHNFLIYSQDIHSLFDLLKYEESIGFENTHKIFVLALGSYYKKISGIIGSHQVVLRILPESLLNYVLKKRAQNKNIKYSVSGLFNLPQGFYESLNGIFDNNKFYIDAQHGLGNRLRAIGSAAAIAKATGKELVIVWEPDHHCNCRFSDLFDYQGEVIEKAFVDEARENGNLINYMEIEEGADKGKEIIVRESIFTYTRSAYTLVHNSSDWESENEFIKSLRPSKQVRELIESIDVDGRIAVHVRMEAGEGLDGNSYDSSENWTQEGHEELHFWRNKSHYSHFIKRIDQLLNEDSTTQLFLATDLPKTYEVFHDCYGSRLKFLKRDVYERSKEQIIFALADAILLSRCNKLLGSTWSSFSELASRLSNNYKEIEMSGRDF